MIPLQLLQRSSAMNEKILTLKPRRTNEEKQTKTRVITQLISVACNNIIIMVGRYLLPFKVVRAVAAAAAAAAAAILLALPSTFWTCVGDSLAANAFSVCNISTGFRDAGQSGRMGSTSEVSGRDSGLRWRTDTTLTEI